jgi:hypothetical protein
MADDPATRFQIFLHSADVRPDLLDLRDRKYRPPLIALPKNIPEEKFRETVESYIDSGMIRNQGAEGACTGFAMAAVIDFLFWQATLREEIKKRRRRDQAGDEPAEKEPQPHSDSDGDPVAERAERHAQLKSRCPPVSARMLYHLARFYDEWPGEENEGSSLRGVMKAWQRHGVCADEYWESLGFFTSPKPRQEGQPDWAEDAATRPLGVYYRIDKSAVIDMQAAIKEVGAIGVSLFVHEGWKSLLKEEYDRSKVFAELTHKRIAKIKWTPRTKREFMHAVALVGYNEFGFIVQNSWGNEWGSGGFAVLAYDDWIANGADAWAAVLGAPMNPTSPPLRVYLDAGGPNSHFGTENADDPSLINADFWKREKEVVTRSVTRASKKRRSNICKWSVQDCYEHCVILGSNGRAINRLIEQQNAEAAVNHIAFELPSAKFTTWQASPAAGKRSKPKRDARAANPKVAIIALSGLLSDRDELRRMSALGPCFEGNRVYPIFLGWRSGILDPLLNRAGKQIMAMLSKDASLMQMLLGNRDPLETEAWDQTMETMFESGGGKLIWTQLKQDALLSALQTPMLRRPGKGEAEQRVKEQAALYLLALGLADLKKKWPNLEIHLVGHSAGAIALVHFLAAADKALARTKDKTPIKSCTLYAPACSLALVNGPFKGYMTEKRGRRLMEPSQFHVHVLADELEQADSIGPYGKSFLQLVSNALEDWPRTPLLGLEHSSNRAYWNEAVQGLSDDWYELCQQFGIPKPQRWTESKVRIAPSTFVAASHESFPDNIKIVNETLQTITGMNPLPAPVQDLDWRAAGD